MHESVIDFGEEGEGISAEIAMQWTGSYSESVHTFANTINTAEGGTHEEGFRAALTTIVNRWARDQNLIREKDDNLTGEDVREGLTAIIHVKLSEPQFEGQTKQKLGNTDRQVLRPAGLQRPPAATGSSATPARPRPSSMKATQAARAQDRRPPGA